MGSLAARGIYDLDRPEVNIQKKKYLALNLRGGGSLFRIYRKLLCIDKVNQ